LEEYKPEEMIQIVSQYKDKQFPKDAISKEIYYKIADNARGVPRHSIRLLEATVYLGNFNQVLKNFRILKHGYTEKDLKTLEYIGKNDKGVGMQSIASYLGTSTKGYLYEIEPYLLQTGLLVRAARGRKLSSEGSKMLKELRKAKGERDKEYGKGKK
jgi:Holliday junction resolvasome RuvABC ATP-dependent DNA helicase subunit